MGRRTTEAQIPIKDLNVLWPPAQSTGALTQRVLQAQTLLIGQYLVGAGLPYIDEGFVCQMVRGDEFGCRPGLPPG
jgi:hypothetical protein